MFEYKRVLINVCDTIQDNYGLKTPSFYQSHPELKKRHDKEGKIINPDIEDSIEKQLNLLGKDGWLLQTSINLDSGLNDTKVAVNNVVEYIFMREIH